MRDGEGQEVVNGLRRGDVVVWRGWDVHRVRAVLSGARRPPAMQPQRDLGLCVALGPRANATAVGCARVTSLSRGGVRGGAGKREVIVAEMWAGEACSSMVERQPDTPEGLQFVLRAFELESTSLYEELARALGPPEQGKTGVHPDSVRIRVRVAVCFSFLFAAGGLSSVRPSILHNHGLKKPTATTSYSTNLRTSGAILGGHPGSPKSCVCKA